MNIIKRLWLAVLLIGTTAAVPSILASDKLDVTATTTMVTDMVKAVGGDRVNVTGLMGPGVDPHLYKPGAKDIAYLSQAQLIFYSGLMLEGRMADLFSKMAQRGKKVYAITGSIPRDRLLEPASFAGHFDPHVWGNPELWSLCVDSVVTALTENDPAGKEVYKKRGDAVKIEYQELLEWARKRVDELPKPNRVLITSHDAFNYFGLAFGFEVVGVQGISTVSEAGLADITRIVDYIKEKKVKAIFVESSVSPATIKRISKDAGVKIGGELFSDALGTPGNVQTTGGITYDEGTYKGWIGHNINTVVDALK